MDIKLKDSCDLFIENKELMANNFKWDERMMQYLCAFLYTSKNKVVDPERIKNCKKIIKQNTGIFSGFKDTGLLSMAATLSLYDDPETFFEKVLHIYGELKAGGFRSSVYLALTAFSMAENKTGGNNTGTINKAHDVYKQMKSNHPFLTSKEDYGYAVMLAMTDMSVDQITRSVEEIHSELKSNFFSSDAVQSLSHVLTLGDDTSQIKCKKTMDLFNDLKEKNCKYGTGVELCTLGMLTLIADDTAVLVDEIVEVNNYLLEYKGFSNWSIGRTGRVMYASLLVANQYIASLPNAGLNSTLTNSVVRSIIAMQMVMAASASAAATAAASSN